jgi:hypothetical protein
MKSGAPHCYGRIVLAIWCTRVMSVATPVSAVVASVLAMKLTPARQRNAVSEGIALGLVMCERYEVPSETWRLSLAFEGAWRAWDDRFKVAYSQVSTDLRKGLNGYIAMTRADEKKRVWSLYWDRSGPTYKIYAREWCAGDDFDPDQVAASIDGDVTAADWQALARDFLERLEH